MAFCPNNSKKQAYLPAGFREVCLNFLKTRIVIQPLFTGQSFILIQTFDFQMILLEIRVNCYMSVLPFIQVQELAAHSPVGSPAFYVRYNNYDQI